MKAGGTRRVRGVHHRLPAHASDVRYLTAGLIDPPRITRWAKAGPERSHKPRWPGARISPDLWHGAV